jgi:hypothetical protein
VAKSNTPKDGEITTKRKRNRSIAIDLDALPAHPGVYRFYDENGLLIYVGKAKHLRRRLSQYKNARRCKAHAKMRKIKSEAVRLEWETCENEFEALGLESRLIQEHRPKWNVAGAFYFLYPMIGVCERDGDFYLCYTLTPAAFPAFRFHGAFRSRERTRDAFFALTELMGLIGHPVGKASVRRSGLLGDAKAYVYGFRQVPARWRALLEGFFSGESFEAIEELSLLLLEKPTALATSKETQERLYCIRRFWKHEIRALKRAREHSGWRDYPVSQKDRDPLFIALRSKGLFAYARAALSEVSESRGLVLEK